ncbi:hypothetical protein IC620_08565 [Hazenella sp. IB182357]|uniref:Protein kinase domain-containing protein n=1 Tax=Polycladospora coralii TaxID=2771432 RepID=A0A926N640_9BACL|nr:hypothetical protein [Polycladospora coralii]MBD1372409.1 hypothetical protein [Polycladospora coralii]
MESKIAGEIIGSQYHIRKIFPFVMGTLYFTDRTSARGDDEKRFVHALAMPSNASSSLIEELGLRDDMIFMPLENIFIEQNNLYQVFIRMEGGLLAYQIRKRSFSLEEMSWLVAGICSQLLRLELEGQFTLVHPQNIIITKSGAIRFLYGGKRGLLPKHLGRLSKQTEEQIRTDRLYDVYLIGVLIFQILTGKHPVEWGLQVPPLKLVRPDIPEELDQIVSRALSFNLASRPQIEEIMSLLKRVG